MLNERKLTDRELASREEAIQGLLSNKRTLVKKYGKDAEKVMYGIATKQAKSKIESMNKDKLKELIQQSLKGKKEKPLPKPVAKDLNKMKTNFSDLKKRLKKGTITQEDFDKGILDAANAKTNTIKGISGTLERQATQGINEYGPNRVIRKEATDPTQVRKTTSDFPGQVIQSADEIRGKKKSAKTPVVSTASTPVVTPTELLTEAFQTGAGGMYRNTPVKGGSGINMLKKPSTFKMNGYGKKR